MKLLATRGVHGCGRHLNSVSEYARTDWMRSLLLNIQVNYVLSGNLKTGGTIERVPLFCCCGGIITLKNYFLRFAKGLLVVV